MQLATKNYQRKSQLAIQNMQQGAQNFTHEQSKSDSANGWAGETSVLHHGENSHNMDSQNFCKTFGLRRVAFCDPCMLKFSLLA